MQLLFVIDTNDRIMFLFYWTLLLLWVVAGSGFPTTTLENPTVKPSTVLEFMKKYGYVEDDNEQSSALYTEAGIFDIIKSIQHYGAISQTGILDNDTLKLISSPRCGVPDIIRTKRSKRYVIGSGGWNKRTITYFIANWAPSLGETTVIKNIQLALDIWGKYGRLTFRRAPTPDADIIVAFGQGYHGDKYPFDGRGYILAHAYFPYEESSLGGDIHFDSDEDWKDRRADKSEEGTDFFTVALHELGHSLGLSHSATPSSVMFPYYRGFDPNSQLQLGYDDILAMYELYIRRNIPGDENIPFGSDFDEDSDEDEETGATSRTTEISSTTATAHIPTEPTPTERFTSHTERFTIPTERFTSHTERFTIPTERFTVPDEKFTTSTSRFTSTDTSTITYYGDDETVDDHKTHDPRHGIPPTNSPSMPDICKGYFDSVATLRDELFVFKEDYVWRLKEKGKIEQGYPITIHQMFPGLPKTVRNVDAVYQRLDGMIVLFIGKEFWVYNGERFVENSPRPLSDYGLPPTLDSIGAVQLWGRNGKTYFYKHDRFWRYNETAMQMDPGYPKHMERWRGVPEDLDAATTWKDGITYFFKEELYWKFDNEWVIITDSSPLPSPQVWLGCPEDEHSMRRLL